MNKRHQADMAQAAHFVDDYLPALLTQAAHLISGEFHRTVSAEGFMVSEWRVLATLAGGEPMSIGRLSEITVMKQPTVTRLLDRMEASGHVKRSAHEGDRRITLVGITPAGSRVVAGLIPLAREHEQRVLEPFGLARAAELKATLKRMIELHEDSAPIDVAEAQSVSRARAPRVHGERAGRSTPARARRPAARTA